jgi:membrane protein DedA with SNARE-associated domain
MESFLTHWGYAAIFLFGFLEACCIPIPSEITFGFAGVLAGEGHLNIVAVIVVGTIAELIGSYVAYGVGRVGGRPLVHRFGRYLLITQADIDRAERFVAGRGIWAIPVGRALPVVRTFVSIVAGFIEVPPLLFGVLSLIGTAIWVTVISLVGYGVGSAWQSVAHGLAVAGYVILAVAVIAIAALIAYRVREVRREAAHGHGGPDAGGGGSNGTDGRGSNGTGQRDPNGTDQRDSGGTGKRGSGGAHRRGSSDQHGSPPEAEHDPQSSPRSPTS